MTKHSQSSDMADELWVQMQHALLVEGLSYKDLPETDVLFYGALQELSFNSFLDCMNRRKQLAKLLQHERNPPTKVPVFLCTHSHENAMCNHMLVISSSAAAMPIELALMSGNGRLSALG